MLNPVPTPADSPSEIFHILIAEDDDPLRDILAGILQTPQRFVQTSKDGTEALAALEKSRFDVVITDLKMAGADGLIILEQAKKLHPDAVVIIMTGYGSLDSAIQAIRGGAYDYIRKPFKIDEMEIVVHNACEKITLMRENKRLLQKLQETMEEMKKLRQTWDENMTTVFGSSLLPIEQNISEMDLTLKMIPPDFDLRKQDMREKALHDLERLTHLKKEGLIDEQEFYILKKILIKKLSD
jgi:DNA-binding response OmpR family regulator